MSASTLRSGLHERLITNAVKAELDALRSEGVTVAHTAPIDPAEAHAVLARHVETIVARALHALPEKERRAIEPEIANRIVQLLLSEPGTRGAVTDGDAVVLPPEQLHSIRTVTGDPALDRDLLRPLVPLSASDLLVNARGEPRSPMRSRTRSPPPTASTCSAPLSAGMASAC